MKRTKKKKKQEINFGAYTTRELAKYILEYNDKCTKPKLGKQIIQAFLEREDAEKFIEFLLEGFVEQPPRNKDTLHFYILFFLNLNIPRKRMCKKHVAPFTFVWEMYAEKVRNAIAFANRTGGKTTDVAVLNHLDMNFKPGCEICSAGAIKEQATKSYKYFTGFHNDNEYLYDLYEKEPTRSLSVYLNGSSLEIITGSMKGLNGPHPNKARIDEIELMEWDVLQEGLSMAVSKTSPTTGQNFIAQNCFLSTRKVESGTMQRLLDLAKKETRKEGGFKIFEWCIWEILEKCRRKCKKDELYGDCPIYDICKGKAHNCDGFYTIDDFIDKAKTLDKDTLDAQWFNLKPSKQAIVYGDYFDRNTHFIPRKDFDGRDIVHIGGIDFGSSPGHPFVYKEYILDVTEFRKAVEEAQEEELITEKITFYLSYEYRSGVDTMEGHSERIKKGRHWSKDMIIFADPSAKQARIDLENLYGIDTHEADNAILEGIEKVRAHLKDAIGGVHYYIFNDYYDCDEDLIGSVDEFERYKYRRFKDGKVNRKEPEKVNDHGMDIDRYVISSSIVYLKELFTPDWEEVEQGGFWFNDRRR